MILEKVLPHERPEIFKNIVITPHEYVNDYDRFIIKQILYNEFAFSKSK